VHTPKEDTMKTASTLSRVLSLIAAAGVSLALLQSVATVPDSMPLEGHGPVMAHDGTAADRAI
jgi:hypothetical protein